MIITIDGPSGGGKSTVARIVAQKLGLRYLDTGAMYRAVTLHCMRAAIRLEDSRLVAETGPSADLRFEVNPSSPIQVFLSGDDVSDAIRTQEVTRNIHFVADVKEVRDFLGRLQHVFAGDDGVVTEGRDQGSVVFPDADLKIYLYASPEVRAERRTRELKERGFEVDYDQVLEEISRRDYLDMAREIGALRKAPDAIELDTSALSPGQAADEVVRLATERK